MSFIKSHLFSILCEEMGRYIQKSQHRSLVAAVRTNMVWLSEWGAELAVSLMNRHAWKNDLQIMVI